MGRPNEVENIIGSIDYYKAQAYDRLIETIATNIDSMEKTDILNIFNEFVQDLKAQNREMTQGIYQANTTDLALTYAHTTQSHIGRVDATVDQIMTKINQQQIQQQVSENALPGDLFR